MRRIPEELLRRMASELGAEDRDEMAIPSYTHPNPLLRWMAWSRVEAVGEALERRLGSGSPDGRTIVDFGCGTGVLLETASALAARVVGVDPVLGPAQLLTSAWGLARVSLLTTDDARSRIEPGSVDVVIAAEVLEHLEPLAPALAMLRGWLRPGGTLLVSLPTENAVYRLGRWLAGFRGHYHHHDARSIDRRLREGGFARLSLRRIPLGGPLAIYWIAEYRPR